MNTKLLIDAVMRQTTVLIAQLATTGGVRAPLSHIANQVFVDLARELNEQGVSRKVSADMFGMALRAYSGTGDAMVFRVVGEEEARYARAHGHEGRDELLSVLIYREGPFTREELLKQSGMAAVEFDACIERLKASRQVELTTDGRLRCTQFHIPLGDATGWEAAVLDHYHALVRTICARLQQPDQDPERPCGGATYTFEVWPGHPLEQRVLGTLVRLRSELSELRQQVEVHNASVGLPDEHLRVVCYAGQHVLEQSADTETGSTRDTGVSDAASEPQRASKDLPHGA